MSASMLTAPLPPFLPKTPEEFSAHTADHGREWYDYCRLAYEYISAAKETAAQSREEFDLQTTALRQEAEHWKQEYERQGIKLQSIIDYQGTLLQKKDEQVTQALVEREKALHAALPTVITPETSSPPDPKAKQATDPRLGEATPSTTRSTGSTRISERLPDPEKFEGDRKDLRRFVSQVHEKMNVNRDRFPTPQSRMTYVTNRLKGAPYAQILPHIRRGVCQLTDYDAILDILDRAFGDPNRVNNARKELFNLRQTNKDFGAFFAEFQRLALEGEMSEETLPTLLEQAISRELRGMLVHNEPPSREYHRLADFLQDLENRRRHYEAPPAISRNYAAAVKPAGPQASPAVPLPRETRTPTKPQLTASNQQDAMDLSTSRRTSPHRHGSTRRERGECFRCGSDKHLIRDCPYPDTRPVKLRSIETSPVYRQSPSPPRGRAREARSPSLDEPSSPKGVSLI
jgi:hypothetical protein